MNPNPPRARAKPAPGRLAAAAAAAALLAVAPGCTDMYDQAKYETYEASAFFPDGASARPLVDGVVAHEDARDLPPVEDVELLTTGMKDGELSKASPLPVDANLLARGRQRYNVFCTPCHGFLGDARGVVVQRGFSPPPHYTDPRLVEAPLGHFFEVMTNGHGAMYSFAARIPPQDRWAIASYIRALQLSQGAKPADLPLEDQQKLEGAGK